MAVIMSFQFYYRVLQTLLKYPNMPTLLSGYIKMLGSLISPYTQKKYQ